MCHLLKSMGHVVVAITVTGESALQAMARTPVDVVLMDIILEGEMSGIEAARRVRDQFDVPLIFLTSVDSREQVQEAIETNSGAYILKPPAPRELAISLEMVVYRHQTERRLRERESRLAVILQHSKQAVLHYTVKGGIDYLNPEAQRLLGGDVYSLSGEAPHEVIVLEQIHDRQPVSWDRILAGLEPAHTPLRLSIPGQLAAAVTVAHTWVPGQEGESAILTLDDVTSALDAERRMNLLAASVENLSEGLVIARVADEQLLIEYANPVFNRWLAREVPAVGENLGEILDPQGHQGLAIALQGCLEREESERREIELFPTEGGQESRLLEIVAQKLKTPAEGKVYLIAVVRDITRLRRLETNTRQSQKLEAVGRLADGIAHDFNNIIAIITGLSELLLHTTEVDGSVHRRVQQILETSRRGADIISQLMAFSRREKEQVSQLDLKPAMEQFVPLIRHLLSDNVVLSHRIESDLPLINANKTHVEQILLNLCTNARDALKRQGGKITVCAKAIEIDEALSATCQLAPTPGRYVCLCVEDNGEGIPPDLLQSIFDPFFTTKDIGKGTGLGLSTVYGILQKYKGGLAVRSTPNIGTTFSLYFPLATGTGNTSKPEALPVENADAFEQKMRASLAKKISGPEVNQPPEPRRMRALLHERDATLAHAIKCGLEARSWQVQRLRMSLADAIQEIAWHQCEAVIIPPQWMTPKLFGTLTRAVEQNPWLRLIVLIERGQQLSPPAVLNERMCVLTKPLALSELFAQLEQGAPEPTAPPALA